MIRLGYILHRIFEMLVSLVGQAIVNGLFFWEDDHCRMAWEREVTEARRTLARAGVKT